MLIRSCSNLGLVLGLAFAAFVLLLAAIPGTPFAASALARGCGASAKAQPTSLRPGVARDAVLCLVNKQRNKHGLGKLDRDKRLQRAAQRHSDKMDGTGCFDHTCGGEGELGARLQSVDYIEGGLSRFAYGENIAWGRKRRGTPQQIVDAWMHSSGHRANILSRQFRDAGVGFSKGSPSSGGANAGIYTMDFGLRVG
jgi:uncharacterized protein YkwD